MSDTEIQETPAQEIVVPATDQPPEEGDVAAPVVSENPTPAADPAPAAAASTDAPAVAETAGQRAPASDLEGDLRRVCDDYVSGIFKLAEGALPTPHTLAAEIAKRRADGKKVSSGAVSAALIRWQEIGFATLSAKPMAFVDYTDAARSQGLAALKQAHRSAKSAARKPVEAPTTIVPAAPVVEAVPVVAEPVAVVEPVVVEAAPVEAAPAVETVTEAPPF